MLLNCEKKSCVLCSLNDDILVDWLDSVDIDNCCFDTLGCQCFCSLDSLINHKACCNDSYILAVTELNALAKLKLICFRVVENRCSKSAETEINRTFMEDSGFNGSLCFNVVGRVYYHHARDSSHKSDILVALMCCTVFAYRDTCVCCTYLHVEVRITDRVSYLLKCSASGEHCECRSKWYLACCSHTCCNAHHI